MEPSVHPTTEIAKSAAVPHGPKPPSRVQITAAIAVGRNNWLFAGSLRAGKRAAAIMSLMHSARLNGQDPYEYLKDVLEKLPTHPASRIAELLPHRWQASTRAA